MNVYKSSQTVTYKFIYTLLRTPTCSPPNESALPVSPFVTILPASNSLYPPIPPPDRRCQHSLKCPPDIISSLFISVSLPPADQSLSCLMSCLQGWFLSCVNRRSGEHDRRDSSSLSQTIKFGLLMRIWGLRPTDLLLPQGFSVVLPVRAVIGCGRAPSSSSGLRMM